MFLKISKYKNGKTFLSFVQGTWDSSLGYSKQRTVEKLGYLDELSKDFDDPITHFKKIASERNEQNSKDDVLENVKNEKLELGVCYRKNLGYIFLKKIYDELNLKSLLNKFQKNLNINYNLNSVLELLVFSRIMYPSSKYGTYNNKDIFFENFDFSLKDLYRSLDYFATLKDDIIKLMFDNTKQSYNRDTSTTYYDCTNYYFEISYNDEDLIDEEGNVLEKGYRKKGPSKEHKKSPIVGMGLLMDKTGFPLSYDLFPGNESEKDKLRPSLTKTKAKFGIGRTIVVADRGLNTSDNTFFIAGKNNDDYTNHDGYVYGQSVLGADKDFKIWVLDQKDYINDYITTETGEKETYKAKIYKDNGQLSHYEERPIIFKHKSRIFAKEVTIKKDGVRKSKAIIYQKQMVYYSQKYADRQKHQREQAIKKAEDLIKNPGKYNKAASYGAIEYINNLRFIKSTGEIPDGLELSLKQDKIDEEEKYDGYYSIVTSEKELSDKEIRNIYKGLWKIEETFKITKTNLETRPVYVWTIEHIEAHFLTCFISLVILRLLEHKINRKYYITKVIESLTKLSCSHFQDNKYLLDYRDEIIITLEEIFGLTFDMKFQTKQKINSYLK